MSLALIILFYSTVTVVTGGFPLTQNKFQEDAVSPESLFFDPSIDHEPFQSFPCQPKYIHLSQASDVDDNGFVSMTVSFSLDYTNCQYVKPVLFYGRTFPKVDGRISGENRLQFNYTSEKTTLSDLYQSDWIYHIQIDHLHAGGCRYWYRIVVEEHLIPGQTMIMQRRSLRGSMGYFLGETRTVFFHSIPLPHTVTVLALVGDLGQTPNSARTLWEIYKDTQQQPSPKDVAQHNSVVSDAVVSQLLIVGDMSYADSDPLRWIRWMQMMEPLVRTLPMQVLPGNHEIECDTKTNEIFLFYENLFRNPNRIRAASMEPITEEYRKSLWSCSTPSQFRGIYDYGNSFYAYRHGLAHIIALNSYTDTSVGSAQYQWLEEELKNRFDRQATPWLLIGFHAPLYTTFLGHVNESEAIDMKQAMEPLFLKYKVNLVFSGHDHAYMRTHPLAFGKVDTTGNAPVYLTIGAGGNREGHASGFQNWTNPEPWVAKRTIHDFGYGNLLLWNSTHARFHWVRDRKSDEPFHDIVWFKNSHVP